MCLKRRSESQGDLTNDINAREGLFTDDQKTMETLEEILELGSLHTGAEWRSISQGVFTGDLKARESSQVF